MKNPNFFLTRNPVIPCSLIILSLFIVPFGAFTMDSEENVPSEDKVSVTRHQINIDGGILKYTARAGFLPVRDQFGEIKGRFFYTAYTLDKKTAAEERPVTFVWNGGPGAPSSPLHFGMLGPRIKATEGDSISSSAYPVIDNSDTLLRYSDLVMVDPIGTGYSHPVKPEYRNLFWGISQDINSVTEFIRIYLTHFNVLDAPIFLIGESYGTFRAAGVAKKLVEKEFSLMGIIMISTTLKFGTGSLVSSAFLIPSYTAAAFYHKKLSPDLQNNFHETLKQAENWAETEYIGALMRGGRLSREERIAAVDNFSRFTGLDKNFIDKNNLRVSVAQFCRKLLSSEKKIIGRYDTRVTGDQVEGGPYDPTKDPSLISRGEKPFLFVNYLRSELEFRTDRLYRGPFGGIWPPSEEPRGDWMAYNWDWGSILDNKTDQSGSLAKALRMKKDLQVMFASGYYDLATPYFSTELIISHMGLSPEILRRIEHKCYPGGHMMYQDSDVRGKLMQDIFSFYQKALEKK